MWGYLAARIYEAVRTGDRVFAAQGRRQARVLVWIVPAAALLWPSYAEVRSLTTSYRQMSQWSSDGDAYYANYPSPYRSEHLRDEFEVIHYLRAHATPHDRVYVWGTDSRIYYLTGLPSPTRFVPNFPLMSPWIPPEWRQELVDDLTKLPPAFIVVARRDPIPGLSLTDLDSEQYLKVYPEFSARLSARYQPVATFLQFTVYRLRSFHQ